MYLLVKKIWVLSLCIILPSTAFCQPTENKTNWLKQAIVLSAGLDESFRNDAKESLLMGAIALGDVALMDRLRLFQEDDREILGAAAVCAMKSGNAALTEKLLLRLGFSQEKLESMMQIGFLCGFLQKDELFRKMRASLESVPSGSYPGQEAWFDAEPTDDGYIEIDGKKKKRLVDELCTAFAFGILKKGDRGISTMMISGIRSARLQDLLQALRVQCLMNNGSLEAALAAKKTIRDFGFRYRASSGLANDLRIDQLETVNGKKFARHFFEEFVAGGPTRGDDFDRLFQDHIPVSESMMELVHSEENDGGLQWSNASVVLKLVIAADLTKDGLDLLSQLKDEKSRSLWMDAMLNRQFVEGQYRAAEKLIAIASSKKIGKYDDPQRTLPSLMTAAAKGGDFVAAEKFLSQIKDHQKRLSPRLILSAYYQKFGRNQLASGTVKPLVEELRRRLSTKPTDEDRVKYLVDFTMRCGWLLKNEVDQISISAEIISEFGKVKTAENLRGEIEKGLGSFTPPSPASLSILKEVKSNVLDSPDKANRLAETIDQLEGIAEELSVEKLSTMRKGILVDLAELAPLAIDQWAARSALAFAERGQPDAADDMIDQITDEKRRVHTLLACALAFPPATRSVTGERQHPEALFYLKGQGGGFF